MFSETLSLVYSEDVASVQYCNNTPWFYKHMFLVNRSISDNKKEDFPSPLIFNFTTVSKVPQIFKFALWPKQLQ
jgi:hypothetical protein